MNSRDDETTILYPHETWMRYGACLGVDPELFFPVEKGDHVYDQARPVCDACPVEDECLLYAFRYNVRHGMWGGKTPRERQPLRKKWLRTQ